jgi:hypothetical protein
MVTRDLVPEWHNRRLRGTVDGNDEARRATRDAT